MKRDQNTLLTHLPLTLAFKEINILDDLGISDLIYICTTNKHKVIVYKSSVVSYLYKTKFEVFSTFLIHFFVDLCLIAICDSV